MKRFSILLLFAASIAVVGSLAVVGLWILARGKGGTNYQEVGPFCDLHFVSGGRSANLRDLERQLRRQLRVEHPEFRTMEPEYSVSFQVNHEGGDPFRIIRYFRGFGATGFAGYFGRDYSLMGVSNRMALEGRVPPAE
jgi:hypothetical protein